jgi:hypothetical protein
VGIKYIHQLKLLQCLRLLSMLSEEEYSPLVELSDFSNQVRPGETVPYATVVKVVPPYAVRDATPDAQTQMSHVLAHAQSNDIAARVRLSHADGQSLQATEDVGNYQAAVIAAVESESTRFKILASPMNNGGRILVTVVIHHIRVYVLISDVCASRLGPIDFTVRNVAPASNWDEQPQPSAPKAKMTYTEQSYQYTSIYDAPTVQPVSDGRTNSSSSEGRPSEGYVISDYKSIYD